MSQVRLNLGKRLKRPCLINGTRPVFFLSIFFRFLINMYYFHNEKELLKKKIHPSFLFGKSGKVSRRN